MKSTLILEDGTVFTGESVGADKNACFEIVFNTSMVGYPQLITNPAYCGQGVVMTYPVMGSYGVCSEDLESDKACVSALIVRELNRMYSNFRGEESLGDYLRRSGVPCIQGIDTRALTKHIRRNGTMRAMLVQGEVADTAQCIAEIKSFVPDNCVTSCKEKRSCGDGSIKLALLDFGAVNSLVRSLASKGCTVTLYPAETSAEEILGSAPDAVVIAGGSEQILSDCDSFVKTVGKLMDSGIPVLGCGVGHLLCAMSRGADIEKLTYGHRGTSNPVRDTNTGSIIIAAQDHGFCVANGSVKNAAVTFENVNDHTCEGLEYSGCRALSVQFSPEPVFEKFFSMIGGNCNA